MEDKTLFHDEFVHYLKYAMIVYKREPAVENVIEFAAKFASSFQSPSKSDKEGEKEKEEEEGAEEEEDDHPFLTFIFNFLLEVHMLVVVISRVSDCLHLRLENFLPELVGNTQSSPHVKSVTGALLVV